VFSQQGGEGLLVLLLAELGVLVGDLDVELLGTLDDLDTLGGRDCYGVFFVVAFRSGLLGQA